MPSAKGQLEDPPVAGVQFGSSVSSLAPVIALFGSVGFTAIGDSFCLFCGKWNAGAVVGYGSTSEALAACAIGSRNDRAKMKSGVAYLEQWMVRLLDGKSVMVFQAYY